MYKTLHGLVLREVKYKESSKILTILTEEEGKITAEARGALRKGSKCSAASQVLTWSELTFFENRGRYTLTEGSVLEDFAALRADLGDYALGCYMAELLEAVSDEDSHSTALLHLGLNALFALSRQLYPAKHIKAVFELRLMCLAGFAPQLDRCTDCGLAHARKAAPESLRRRRPLHRLHARRAGKVGAALRCVARCHASRVLGGGEEDLFLYAGRVVGRALLHGLRGIHPRAARPRLRYARLLALAAKSVNDNIFMLTILR